jgi:phage terminase large subunit-like protein
MRTCGDGPFPKILQYKRRVEWPDGAMVSLFSGEEPESLRGSEFELVCIDEIAAMRYAREVFTQADFCLRNSEHPRMIIATTPKPTPFIRELIKMEGVRITRSTTFDNEHLSAAAVAGYRKKYEGTRDYLQELMGELIEEPENALFKSEWLKIDPIPEDTIEQVSIGVDPSGGSDEIGIVAAALLSDARLGVLADRSLKGTPSAWGEAVVRAHDDFMADDCAVETNYGGEMATEVIKQAAKRMHQRGERADSLIRIKTVVASRGKVMRAEPISYRAEQGQVLMRPNMPKLVGEFLRFSRDWNRDVDGSPNRLDAAIWALSRLNRVVTNIAIAE